jgi:hypothetical protein
MRKKTNYFAAITCALSFLFFGSGDASASAHFCYVDESPLQMYGCPGGHLNVPDSIHVGELVTFTVTDTVFNHAGDISS